MLNNQAMKEQPYFMSDQAWYYFDEADFCYKLTDQAPPEAVQSYEEFYESSDILE